MTTNPPKVAAVAWLLAATFYFYQYALRSTPSVMMPELSEAFGLNAMGVASIVSLFYYGYSPFSLIAGAAMDRVGPRHLLPLAAGVAGFGTLLFATGNRDVAGSGCFLQGAGGVFALVGAIYIANREFPPASAATLVGATQMFGMAGGSAGQFVVGRLMAAGIGWSVFWTSMGIAGLALAVLLYLLLPGGETPKQGHSGMKPTMRAFRVVFTNPQSILCGLIAGLLFIPTTIFAMTWGVRYLQEGHGFDYGAAVMRSAMVPFGWIIGCPLLGYLSDRIGRRKPVIVGGAAVLLGCVAWILHGPKNVLPPNALGLFAGIASGSAMLTYTVIKEANPPQFAGTATGVINFLNYTFSALLAPVFAGMLQRTSGGTGQMELGHYQSVFTPLMYGVVVAILLAFMLRETGPAARTASANLSAA